MIFQEAGDKPVDNIDDYQAITERLGSLKGKVENTLLVSQKVDRAMATFWNDEAKQDVAEYLRSGDIDSVAAEIQNSGMSNNKKLTDILWEKKNEKQYLINGAPIFRAQYIGEIEDFVALQIAAETDPIRREQMQQNGSRLIERMFAVESSKYDTIGDSLQRSINATRSVGYLQEAGIADTIKNQARRAELGSEMNSGADNFQLNPVGIDLPAENGQVEMWEWDQAHVLTGAIMMNVDPQLLGEFIIKDRVIKPGKNPNEKIVIARMQNGCQGNLFTAVLKRPQQPEPVSYDPPAAATSEPVPAETAVPTAESQEGTVKVTATPGSTVTAEVTLPGSAEAKSEFSEAEKLELLPLLDSVIAAARQQLTITDRLQTSDPLKQSVREQLGEIIATAEDFKFNPNAQAIKEYYTLSPPSETEKAFINAVIARVDDQSDFHRQLIADEQNLKNLPESEAKARLAESYQNFSNEFRSRLVAMRNHTVESAPTAAANDALRVLVSIETEQVLRAEIARAQAAAAPQAAPSVAPLTPAAVPAAVAAIPPAGDGEKGAAYFTPAGERPVTFSAPVGDRKFAGPMENLGIIKLKVDAEMLRKEKLPAFSAEIDKLKNSPTKKGELEGELAQLTKDLEGFEAKAGKAIDNGEPIIAALENDWRQLNERIIDIEKKISGAQRRDKLPSAELTLQRAQEKAQLEKKIKELFGASDRFALKVEETDALKINGESYFGDIRFSRVEKRKGEKVDEFSADEKSVRVKLENNDPLLPVQIKDGENKQRTLENPIKVYLEFDMLTKLKAQRES